MHWKLINGRAQDVLPGGYAGQVALIVTSPPYDGMREYGGYSGAFDFPAVADACVACLMPGGVLVWVVGDQIVDGGESGTAFSQALHFRSLGLRIHQTLIFQRWTVNGMCADRYHREHEYMFVLTKNGRPRVANMIADRRSAQPEKPVVKKLGMGRTGDVKLGADNLTRHRLGVTGEFTRRGSVWQYSVGGTGNMVGKHEPLRDVFAHPAIFPYALAADQVRSWSNPGDLVLDPMAGSGTTLRAAVDLGREAVGVEVNPEYCELIRERMRQEVLI